MKHHFAAIAIAFMLALCAGCANSLHKPTTDGNVGTTALVAYSAEGVGLARQVLKQPTCATPPVYPCVTADVKQKVDAADEAAHKAAKAADAAGATQKTKDDAAKALEDLKREAHNAGAT